MSFGADSFEELEIVASEGMFPLKASRVTHMLFILASDAMHA